MMSNYIHHLSPEICWWQLCTTNWCSIFKNRSFCKVKNFPLIFSCSFIGFYCVRIWRQEKLVKSIEVMNIFINYVSFCIVFWWSNRQAYVWKIECLTIFTSEFYYNFRKIPVIELFQTFRFSHFRFNFSWCWTKLDSTKLDLKICHFFGRLNFGLSCFG